MIIRLILCLVPLIANAGTLSDAYIKKEMTDFYSNPKDYYNKPVKKLRPGLTKTQDIKEKKLDRKNIKVHQGSQSDEKFIKEILGSAEITY